MKLTDQELKASIEQATKEKLRQNGLSHLSAKVRLKSGDDFEVEFSGGTTEDISRAYSALGITSPEINTTEVSSGDIGRIDPAIDIERAPHRSRRLKNK